MFLITPESYSYRNSFPQSVNSLTASISGVLTAKTIQSDTIDSLSSQVASTSSLLSTNYQLLTTNINSVQQDLANLKNQPLPDPQYYQNLIASNSSFLTADYQRLTTNDLTSTGMANLYKASIADSLVVGSLFIQDNSILALASELKLSALSQITLFDGSVTIARNGKITTQGQIVAQGGIQTNEIKPINDDLSIKLDQSDKFDKLDQSKLKIINSENNEVASIDASGSATFADLSFNEIATDSAVIADSGLRTIYNEIIPAIQTNAEVAGQGILPLGAPEIIIYNDKITKDSLVYLTKTGDTSNEPLTVVKKEVGEHPYFSVSTGNAQHGEIMFNWLIIN